MTELRLWLEESDNEFDLLGVADLCDLGGWMRVGGRTIGGRVVGESRVLVPS